MCVSLQCRDVASRKAEVIEGKILNVSVFCPVAVINTLTNSNLQRKMFIWFILPGHSSSLVEVRAGT